MSPARISRVVLYVAEALLLVGTAVSAARIGHVGEWRPALLVALLLGLALLGQWLSVEIDGGQLSASQIAIVLAMGLLGPVPAAACGVVAMVLTSASRRIS